MPKRCAQLALFLVLQAISASSQMASAGDRELVFGGDSENPPFEYVDRGMSRGFNVELAKAIAEHGDASARYVLSNWSETLGAFEAGTIDVVTMFHTEEREQRYLFTPPFHFINHYIYARKGTPPVSDVERLAGSRVTVERASYAAEKLMARRHEIDLVLSDNALTALRDLEQDRADFAILSAPMADKLIATHQLNIARVSQAFWALDFAFAVRKDEPELSEWLTQQLYATLRDGTYQQIYERWQDELDPDHLDEATQWRWFLLVLFSTFFVASGLFVWLLRIRKAAYAKRLDREMQARRDAERQVRWLSDHNLDSELPRLTTFSRHVDLVLARDEPGAPVKQVVAIKLVDMDLIIHAQGHDARAATVKNFARWLTTCGFEAYGQDGRDLFFAFDTKEKIGNVLRRPSADDTAIIQRKSALPEFLAGAASWPMHGHTADDLIRRAETALSKATKDRDYWVEYEPAMDNSSEDLHLISLFQSTAAAGLYAAYQPQIDLRTKGVVGAEALARWDAEGIGAIPPSKFIPLLEGAGLIRHVTLRMLKDAIRVASTLRRNSIPCPISVNVSVSDLLSPKLPGRVQKMLEDNEGLPEDLQLELTETSVADNLSAVKQSIETLRAQGIATSIDDFGTGFSSLSYLSGFPVKSVKLDQSFVAGMTHRPQDASIVRSTIAMAHELGLLVCAEGVETEEQLRMLAYLGCDHVQGYLISKPLREHEFARLLRRSRS